MFLEDKVSQSCCAWKHTQTIQPSLHLLCGGFAAFRDIFFSMKSNLIKLNFHMDLRQTFPSPLLCNRFIAPSPPISKVDSWYIQASLLCPQLTCVCFLSGAAHAVPGSGMCVLWLASCLPLIYCQGSQAVLIRAELSLPFSPAGHLTTCVFSNTAAVCHEAWQALCFQKLYFSFRCGCNQSKGWPAYAGGL